MDNLAVVITSLATLVTAIGGVIIGLINASKLTGVHKAVNGKMEELVTEVRAASFAKGVKQEKDKAKK